MEVRRAYREHRGPHVEPSHARLQLIGRLRRTEPAAVHSRPVETASPPIARSELFDRHADALHPRLRLLARRDPGDPVATSNRRDVGPGGLRSEEHTSELQSLMRISYAVFCLKKKNKKQKYNTQ